MEPNSKVTSDREQILEIEKRLEDLYGEQKKLVAELNVLRSRQTPYSELPAIMGVSVASHPPSTNDEKADLFIKLFRVRESVYPKLWENATKGRRDTLPPAPMNGFATYVLNRR